MELRITAKQALALISPFKERGKLRIHTLTRNMGIIGCNVDLSDIKARIKQTDNIFITSDELAGHAVGFWDTKYKNILFMYCDKDKLKEISELIEINLVGSK